jgi:hypothetical protein
VSEIETPPIPASAEEILATRLRVPQTVVFRSFPTETVVLNLNTGRYHGLNPSAGRMLEAMTAAPSVGEAARVVAAEYGQPAATVEADICALCRTLLDRGLVEVEDDRGDG